MYRHTELPLIRATQHQEPTSRIVGINVRRLRAEQGLSLRALSAKMPADHRIRHTALGELERGERRATVDDLTALALAFGVGIVALLMPHTKHADGPEVTITGRPGGISPVRLLGWLIGFRNLDGDDASRSTIPPWAWKWSLDDRETLWPPRARPA